MFGYNYKYAMHADKNIIKLRPTTGTYAKALLPHVLAWAGLYVLFSAASRDITVDPDPMLNPNDDE